MGSLDPLFIWRSGPNPPTYPLSVGMHLRDYLITFTVLGLYCRNNDISETLVSACKRCPRSGFCVATMTSRAAPDVPGRDLLHIVPHLRCMVPNALGPSTATLKIRVHHDSVIPLHLVQTKGRAVVGLLVNDEF